MGSQDVTAAKCFPGHSMAAEEQRKRTRHGVGEEESVSEIDIYFENHVGAACINVTFQGGKHKRFISN